jgi:hypothetical protein
VVVSQPSVLATPLVYAMARADQDLVAFINTWVELRRKDHAIPSLYDYWILGRTSQGSGPRWSIIRDLLHLVH